MKKNNRIIVAVQARMGSTRLPQKVLMDINGRPMLWHIVNRLKGAASISEVVIATTNKPLDEAITAFAEQHGIPYYAGSEDDLVDRLYQTAVKFNASALVRITADCPFADPVEVDKVVSLFCEDAECDYASNWSINHRTFPHGLEVEIYSTECLKRLWTEVSDPLMREWIPFNVQEHPDKFNIKILNNDTDLTYLRITVDYEEDLVLAKKIYSELYREDKLFYMDDIVELLSRKPEMVKINEKHGDKKGVEGYIEKKGGQ